MTKKIGIIGCGWLGLPLAKSLIKKDFKIKGTTTSKDKIKVLQKAGISPYMISLSEDEIKGPIANFSEDVSILVINIPPGLRGKGPKQSYVKKLELLHKEIKKSEVEKVIFISSTSVYGSVEGEVTEETKPKPSTESGKQLLVCEKMFQEDEELHTTVIRFGGLIGPDRHPVTMLSGRANLTGGNAPVNLIHLNDCINLIYMVINNELWNTILNGVYPDHPLKEDYYKSEAQKRGIKPPDYQKNEGITDKKVTTSSSFLIKNDVFFTSIRS